MESYVFYRSFHEAFENLSEEDYGKIMRFINEYALNDIEPQIDDSVMKMAFHLIRPQIDANARRREHGKLGGRPKKIEESEAQKKEENEFVKKETTKRFQKPTIDEVVEYIKEKGFSFDPQRFIDYYESKGWMIGKSPMKNWKSACNTWERNNNSFNPGSQIQRDSENIEDYENYFKPKGEENE